MIATVLGLQRLDFEGNDGHRITGTNIFAAFPDENVQVGFRTDRFFIRDDVVLPKDLKMNDEVTVFFDRRGHVEKVELVKN